ncbi:hypothetical protein [Listeria fleischmannii]|jgi:hypothetical protein|uniref:ABM domain-containing protein n=1 Tax=Listeria fleischmannii TaxID=1069827 RepID=A0A841YGU8_9LIST|nr:hypothetical protein [Listeria fleischmannii]EIA19081.1 hypothetical protein KKC_14345 [Listeria fleischmannii subsp. coloradonensis]MBC1399374.1 hypothetical protein [Listeria fleischmannii]MBC1418063.1 hypothetical protein [Listeria fleischmannii]MBC1427691.1 hypothetical protein [Listeria fleischmannii]STY35828.1 Uncharacterised protein [Listeria fleischmannii subsp. coloradonensis]
MIKVVFTYKTKKQDLPELMAKFAESGSNPKFHSEVSNEKIEMFKRTEGEDVYMVLDIYYATKEAYETRTAFERSQPEWNAIWFSEDNKHEEVSVQLFEVL